MSPVLSGPPMVAGRTLTPRSSARTIAVTLGNRRAGSGSSARSITSAAARGTSAARARPGGRRRPAAPRRQGHERHRGELPLVALRGRVPAAAALLGRRGHHRRIGREPGRDAVAGHRPLPAEQPQAAGRRHVHRCAARALRAPRRRRAPTRSRPRPPAARAAPRDALRPLPPHPLRQRLARDPPAQVARAPARLARRGPVVVRRRDRGMVAVGERARLGEQPVRVRRVGRAHERERPPQRVDQLLEVPLVLAYAVAAPRPAGRELPVRQVRRQGGRGIGARRGHGEAASGCGSLPAPARGG
jgi:hypothetical protein